MSVQKSSEVGTTASTRVAVATNEREQVVQHFGRATVFTVYDVSADGAVLVDKRPNEPPCAGSHAAHEDLLGRSADLIRDCDAVVVGGFGAGARGVLERQGISAHVDYDLIETALAALVRAAGAPTSARRAPASDPAE